MRMEGSRSTSSRISFFLHPQTDKRSTAKLIYFPVFSICFLGTTLHTKDLEMNQER